MRPFNSLTIEAFASHCEGRGMSPHTVRAYRGDCLACWRQIGNHEDTESFRDAVYGWLNRGRLTWKPRSTKRRLASLTAVAGFLGADGLFKDYIAPTPERAVPHPLANGLDDLRAMMNATHDVRKRALLALCGLCGLRIAEALNVSVNDFDADLTAVHVRSGKGAKDRVVPIAASTRAYLAPCVAKAKDKLFDYSYGHARDIVATIAHKAGVGHVSTHDLRSTYLTEIYRATKDLRVTQELAGHASSTTTEIYTQVRMDDMRAAVELVAI